MPTFNQKCYQQADPHPKIDRKIVMKLWLAFNREPSVQGKDGTQTVWCHEHPALPFTMVRFFERETLGSWLTNARFCGTGWEMTFAYRKTRGKDIDVIDWNVGLWLARENDFQHEWTLATIAA